MTTTTRTSALLQRVRELCGQLAAISGGALNEALAAAHASLDDPLRVAVVGRVSAGKSTLVNALIGRRIAATASGECTRVVTWYRYGAPDRAELELRSGERRQLRVDRGLPDDLGVPAEEVERIVVHLQSGRLRDLTLIDTPGLASLTGASEDATRRAVLGDSGQSQRAAGQADAAIFVFREAERAAELDFLREFHDASGELEGSAVNAVGVLSHADLFGDSWRGDPFAQARDRAARLAASNPAEVGVVLPVSGLLAESARTGRIREQDARALAALAATDSLRLQMWERLGLPGDVDRSTMQSLLDKIGPHGVAAGRTQAGYGAAALTEWLERTSGIRQVEDVLRRNLVTRTDALKAARILEVLDDAAAAAPDPGAVRDAIEQARMEPVMHPLRELRALLLLVRTVPDSPLRAELEMLSQETDDRTRTGLPPDAPAAELADAARSLAARAQATASTSATLRESEVARVIARSYQLIAHRAEAIR